MAADNMRLRVVLDLVERVVAPLKRISTGSSDAAKSLKATRDRLKELNQQQAMVGDWRTLRTGLADTAAKLTEAQAKVAQLARTLHANGPPTRAMERDFARARREAESLGQQHERQAQQVQQLREKLRAAGISTRDMSTHERGLRQNIAATTAEIDRQNAALRAQADHQRKLAKLREQHAKAMVHTGMAVGAGVAMQAAGKRGVQMGMGPVRDFSAHQDHMLGIARQVEGARDDAGNLTPVYRAIEEQIRGLSHRIPLATTAITDMVTAAARMEVPTDKLAEFTLMASEMATAFDAVPDQITESMGKVAKNFKIPLTEIRGLADSINYLDDNAISKGADIIDFLNRTSGVVSTVAMKAQDAAALGSTLLTLGERAETASTAANAIVQKFAAATKGTKKFKAAMDEIGLAPGAIQKGMATDATATLLKVVDSIGKLPEEKRIGVMVELVGMEHSDTLAKLVDKPEELRRQLELANSQKAQGSMAREAEARNAVLSAQWQMTKNRAFNLSAAVGESLEPELLKLLKVVNPLLEGFSNFVKNNKALVSWVLGAFVAVSALVAVLGTLLIPLALIAGKVMLVRFLMARLGMAVGGTLLGALRTAGATLLSFGRLLMVTPLGAIVAGIAMAALLVYKYWGPIGAFLGGVWAGFSGALAPAFRAVGAALAPLMPVGEWLLGWLQKAWDWFGQLMEPMQASQQQLDGIASAGEFLGQVLGGLVAAFVTLPMQLYDIGANVVRGFVNGMLSGVQWIAEAAGGIANSVMDFFRQPLGINSPSKVFMQYGAWVSEGAAIGIRGGQGAVRTAALALATTATAAAPGMAGQGPVRFDSRPPLQAAAPQAPAPMAAGASYSITINPAPGMDPQAIARAVSAELDRRERAKRSRVLSQLSDID